ncbi:hypothetical protein DVH26_29620 [Paenibacillus sp. H1-7]|uniref:hypothetical protein n=1 Tax=Paenibacillus sp. H1-7 TaxID=2282849 RepID=UPI001EF76B71|nr:hypothetical protein [Paenibacillus sp. H1-7]ULL18257.1 hypothetical protein DVH26_29620 [Paenibacillus sp. H1-7]
MPKITQKRMVIGHRIRYGLFFSPNLSGLSPNNGTTVRKPSVYDRFFNNNGTIVRSTLIFRAAQRHYILM